MNNQESLNFKKERNLGDIVTDTFKFIRLEWKGFYMTILKAIAVPLVVTVVLLSFYLSSLSDVIFDFGNSESLGFSDLNGPFLLLLIVGLLISSLIVYVLMHLSSLYYIKEYVDNKGVVNNDAVMAQVKEKFWSFLGLSVLIFIVLTVSFLFCGLPILYTWPVMSLAPMIFVFGNRGTGDSFNYSFSFVSGKHWADSFGIMFVVALLVGVLGYVFSVPGMIYQIIDMTTSLKDNDPTQVFAIFKDPIYIGFMLFSYIGRFFLYGVTIISNSLIYFDINEQKNASGTLEEIESLGQ